MLEIKVVTGIGEGSTNLSAFDAALASAGVCNYNLVTLSSMIPEGSKVEVVKKYCTPLKHWGWRLNVVKSRVISMEAGEGLAAGVGWYQLEDGRGMFVEHSYRGDDEQSVKGRVKNDIYSSLSDLCRFRELSFDESGVRLAIACTTVKDLPACALALAVYKAERWK